MEQLFFKFGFLGGKEPSAAYVTWGKRKCSSGTHLDGKGVVKEAGSSNDCFLSLPRLHGSPLPSQKSNGSREHTRCILLLLPPGFLGTLSVLEPCVLGLPSPHPSRTSPDSYRWAALTNSNFAHPLSTSYFSFPRKDVWLLTSRCN